ncbi:MAG: CorA family divalent cation transporter [Nocardioidaceae bacterium]
MQQNDDMRKISAWVAIAAVPTMIAGIYGMNFENMPELTWEYGYFLILAVMVGVCTAMYRAFKEVWLAVAAVLRAGQVAEIVPVASSTIKSAPSATR